jgi:hypothetical protein
MTKTSSSSIYRSSKVIMYSLILELVHVVADAPVEALHPHPA